MNYLTRSGSRRNTVNDLDRYDAATTAIEAGGNQATGGGS
jgi:hypothetical protein